MHYSLSCLCGQAGLSVNTDISDVGICHCSMCRRWSGSPMMAVHVGTAVEVSDEQTITRYASSQWANRGFCKHCGTHLFYQLNHNQEYILPAGLFPADVDFTLTSQIYIDHKPPYYEFANATTKMTEAEFLASIGVEV